MFINKISLELRLSTFCKMVEAHTKKFRYLIFLKAVFIKKGF